MIYQLFANACVCSFSSGEDELEISPYDDTQIDTRMASLVAGKTHSDMQARYTCSLHYD